MHKIKVILFCKTIKKRINGAEKRENCALLISINFILFHHYTYDDNFSKYWPRVLCGERKGKTHVSSPILFLLTFYHSTPTFIFDFRNYFQAFEKHYKSFDKKEFEALFLMEVILVIEICFCFLNRARITDLKNEYCINTDNGSQFLFLDLDFAVAKSYVLHHNRSAYFQPP